MNQKVIIHICKPIVGRMEVLELNEDLQIINCFEASLYFHALICKLAIPRFTFESYFKC